MAIRHQLAVSLWSMSVYAIIVAAGQGSRAGTAQPKQFENLCGRPVYRWSLDAFLSSPSIDKTCLVLPAGRLDAVSADLAGMERLICVEGGDSRSASVRQGLDAVGARDSDIVLVHDAARPGLDQATISGVLAALHRSAAAAPALPVIDALKRRTGDKLTNVERDSLYRIQTPQGFRAGLLRRALSEPGASFVDDLAAIEATGESVALVPGSERLSKITFAEDFGQIERQLTDMSANVRTGSGFDVHQLEPGEGVTLCGVFIEHGFRLKGHSDADVGWHALTDAIFGALALGDLGDHFPPSDDCWKGADSAVFLAHALELAQAEGWRMANCDITLICEQPRIKPHRMAMRNRTATITGLPMDVISIKATTTEGLGFAGRREGIAAMATVLMQRTPD